MRNYPAFKKHRFLKALAIVTVAGAVAYSVGVIKPYLDARSIGFSSCNVYYVNGSDFVRITDPSHGVYTVGETEREVFSFSYDRGTYFCQCDGTTWKMRLANPSDILDLRSGTYLWGTAI